MFLCWKLKFQIKWPCNLIANHSIFLFFDSQFSNLNISMNFRKIYEWPIKNNKIRLTLKVCEKKNLKIFQFGHFLLIWNRVHNYGQMYSYAILWCMRYIRMNNAQIKVEFYWKYTFWIIFLFYIISNYWILVKINANEWIINFNLRKYLDIID